MNKCEKCTKPTDCEGSPGDVVICPACEVSSRLERMKKPGSVVNVSRPSHYDFKMDIIDYCQTNKLDFMVGNVIKYVMRHKQKNGIDDLRKALTYLKRIAKFEYNEDLS
jgi:hypothetical protein